MNCTLRRGLKSKIEKLWIEYNYFDGIMQRIEKLSDGNWHICECEHNEFKVCKNAQQEIKGIIDYYQGLENDLILINLDACFNGLSDLSDLVYSYLFNISCEYNREEKIASRNCIMCNFTALHEVGDDFMSYTTRRGLKLKIENLWKDYHKFNDLIQQNQQFVNDDAKRLEQDKQYDVKQLINYYQGLELNQILLDLDACFNDLQDLSDLVWSYLSSINSVNNPNIFYCVEHKEMIYSKQCPKCVINHPNFKMRYGEHYFNGEIEIDNDSDYNLHIKDPVDQATLNMIPNDRDKNGNGWYTTQTHDHEPRVHNSGEELYKSIKLVYLIYYCGYCKHGGCRFCGDIDYYLLNCKTSLDDFISYQFPHRF